LVIPGRQNIRQQTKVFDEVQRNVIAFFVTIIWIPLNL
jgi:hypothetical protein